MKQEIKFVAFDNSIFDDPDKCKYYEILRCLNVKCNVLKKRVSQLMRKKSNITKDIIRWQNSLHDINIQGGVEHKPYLTREHLLNMATRIEIRSQLKEALYTRNAIKRMLIETDRELSKTIHTINKIESVSSLVVNG